MQQQIIQYCCLHASGCWYFSFFSVLLALDCFPIQMTAAVMASTLKRAYLSIYNWSVFFGRLAISSPLWNLDLLSCWWACWMIRICVDVGCRCSTTRCWIVYLDVYVASREASPACADRRLALSLINYLLLADVLSRPLVLYFAYNCMSHSRWNDMI